MSTALRVLVDVAGAAIGGSGRFLSELDAYIEATNSDQSVKVIGRGQRLTPTWLARRELLARGAELRIALNNASFVLGGGKNIVLLRNVLHFASPSELSHHGYSPSLELRLQIPVIRGVVRRADRVVVPTSTMAHRVIGQAPHLKSRIVARGHPVSQQAWAGEPGSVDVGILAPIVPSPYKHLDWHLGELLEATYRAGLEHVPITVTANAAEVPRAATYSRVKLIGRVPSAELDGFWRKSLAIYYPTSLEAFGYPLAEARVNGRFVIGQDNAQNREVAGAALSPFNLGNADSLAAATIQAISNAPTPDTRANDPLEYFSWLLQGAGL